MTDDQIPGHSEENEAPGISRAEIRNARADSKRNTRLIVAGVGAVIVVALTAVGVFLFSSGEEKPAPTTTTTTSTTTSTTTTIPAEPTAVMALTGMPVNAEDPDVAAKLMTPALTVKIDNAPEAHPQVGIQDADVVVEVMVEGISRYIAVFQSHVPDEVGPVRSARTSDPDILAMFGKPVFAWSGGNKNVMKVINNTEWIVNASHDKRQGDYFRERTRKAPHNLIIRAQNLLAATASSGIPPQQLFTYRPLGEESPGAPVGGFDVSIGKAVSSFRWDPETSKWVKLTNGEPQSAANGSPIAATNVVVAQTEYRQSPADRRSPEAETIGEGAAWVFTGGKMILGRWSRASREAPWSLVDEAGTPVALTPGNTWVLLPAPPQAPRTF
ncbi:MAG: DUF3048 domain-containing protein [Microthrixaceae bacterium]|nr:DUF3048 domain-containing protein [Microthrixaceae bacterium]